MGLPSSFAFLVNVEVVLRPSVGDAEVSYAVTCDGDDWGDLVCQSGSWVFEPAIGCYTSPTLADIAEALEALNALENGGRNE